MAKETPAKEARRGRFWLNVGEIAAVLAVAIAGLNYWDSHREHTQAQKAADAEQKAHTALVLKGSADANGQSIALDTLDSNQAIQSQRFVFPTAVLGEAKDVDAAKPRIDLNWISDGLCHALDREHAKGSGDGRLPVGVVTTYVEDGETRTDQSIYEVGYAYHGRFLLGRRLTLRGLSLSRRSVGDDLQAAVNRQWASAHPASGAAPT
jgi:hypothetical protein